MPNKIDISVVVPVFNEVKNVPILYKSIDSVLRTLGKTYEIIFIDDGSRDGTREKVVEIAEKNSCVKSVLFRKNFGQSAAMDAGFGICRGDIVITMDGDLQNDPEDIPMLIEKISEGFDVVSGWRKNRKDKLLVRKIPSMLANKLICSLTDVKLHDTGCALKAFRRDVIEGIRLYGELHRFIPALAKIEGATISEVVVHHHHRKYGKSKYNLTRTFRVLMDLFTLRLLIKHLRAPLRFFGKIGFWIIFLGFATAMWMLWQMFGENVKFADLNVIITLVFLFLVAGSLFIFMGLIASLIVRTGERRGFTLRPVVSNIKRGK